MRIKRIDIVGFKSFVDKVSLDFQQGITCIVGPNGCGKSNVVDAIRWVMGEQSAKNLRGKSMEDVIFGGSEFRKPLGMAEVTMLFSTDDGVIPAKYLGYSEIQVTRRLYRDGESEYLLNKTPCRLLDITELFMDTGIGARAYSIIEQGKIGMILHSKPEERRFLIEEAAGVTKFKARKQVALKKIEHTRQNLVRIGDIVAEIRRQLNALQRQAKKAEKFRECREELKEIEFLFAAASFNRTDSARKQAEEELQQLNRRVEMLEAELSAGEMLLEEKRISLLEQEKGVTTAQEGLYRIKGDIQTIENRLEFQRKELAGLQRHQVRFAEELAILERQLDESQVERTALDEKRGEFVSEIAGEEQSLVLREADLEEKTATERDIARKLEEARRELFAVLSELAQLGNQHGTAVRRLEGMTERFERSHREGVLLGEKTAEAEARVISLERSLLELAEEKDGVTEQQTLLRRREEELRHLLVEADKALQSARDSLSSRSSRLNSLKELDAQFEGYGQGVRSVLVTDRFKGRFSGVVADYIETGEEYEAALETVLAERLQYVLSSTDVDALAGVAFLKETGGGRCSFIAGGVAGPAIQTCPDGAVPLLDRVTIAHESRKLIEPLLRGAFIAESLEQALAFSRSCPTATFVTSQGDLVHSGGVIHGGSAETVHQGLIHKKREIKDLGIEVSGLSVKVKEHAEQRQRFSDELSHVEEELQGVRNRLHQTEIQIVNVDKDLVRGREECQRLDERLTIRKMEEEQLLEEREALELEMQECASRRADCEEKKSAFELETANLQETLVVSKREVEEIREVVTALKVRAAALREKRESNLRASKRLDELIADLRTRSEGHRQELSRGEADIGRLTATISEDEEALQTLLKKQLDAEMALVSIKECFETEADVVRQEDIRLKGVRNTCDEGKKGATACSFRLAELTLDLKHLSSNLMDKYRVDIHDLLPRYRGVDFDESERRNRQGELARIVDEMGEVNLTAIEEYRELDERFNFLSTQKADLEESLHSLQQAIQRINRTTRKRFQETFHQVNTKFQEVFPRLFCGGSAELRLTNEEDLLETGIDIVVQPPGKKLQNVTLLSGGEKALTAVALIFSIFLIKPSPFCLLDEVDAPLDDANIGRFNDMVREMSAVSQFIIITHNKATMAVADTLYGVTMEEPGASKLVSVRLN